jgi:hypothetical protein
MMTGPLVFMERAAGFEPVTPTLAHKQDDDDYNSLIVPSCFFHHLLTMCGSTHITFYTDSFDNCLDMETLCSANRLILQLLRLGAAESST